MDVIPQFGDLARGIRVAVQLSRRSSVDHTDREVDPLVDGDGGHGSVLRKSHGSLGGDPGASRGAIDDKDHGFPRGLHQVNRRADGTEVVRTGPCRDGHQFRDINDGADVVGDRRRRVDDDQRDAGGPELVELSPQIDDVCLGEQRCLCFSFVPPSGKASLRIGVDQSDWTFAVGFRLDSEMTSKGCFADATLL